MVIVTSVPLLALFLSKFLVFKIHFPLNFLFDIIMPSVHFFPFKILPYLVQTQVLHQNPQYRNPAFCSHQHVNRNEMCEIKYLKIKTSPSLQKKSKFSLQKVQNKRVEFQADDAEVRKVKNSKLWPHLEVRVKPEHHNTGW